MSALDKEIIKEDLYFIRGFMKQLVEMNPELTSNDVNNDTLRRIRRRISDIATRVES